MLSSLILAALPLLASAAPTPDTDFISSLAKRADGADIMSQCDISAIKMDLAGLPPVSPGLVLDHIAVGRGTQNYTCADDLETSVPKAAGAVAVLYNVTCMAGPYAPLLATLPQIALRFPAPSVDTASPANRYLLGNHYFTNNTTPFFNLKTEDHDYGMMACGRLNGTDAKNKDVDVSNLKLKAHSTDGSSVQEVYRLNSAGGQPPKTCKGLPKTFEVQYATVYWFWKDPAGPLKTGSYSS